MLEGHLEQILHSARSLLLVAAAVVRGQILEQRTTALMAALAGVALSLLLRLLLREQEALETRRMFLHHKDQMAVTALEMLCLITAPAVVAALQQLAQMELVQPAVMVAQVRPQLFLGRL
jgi:hypothetical protein